MSEHKSRTEEFELDVFGIFTAEDLQDVEYDTVKYVRVAGEYRFCGIMTNHRELLKDGEKALSAGFVHLATRGDSSRCFRISGYSSTLKVSPDDHDEERLTLILDREPLQRSPWLD